MVEFAIVAPLLFALVIGAIDFSRALNYYNDLTQLAGQGARAASVNRNPDGTSIAGAAAPCNSNFSIQCELATVYPTTPELKNGIKVCIPTLPSSAGQPVTVKTSMNFRFFSLPLGIHLGSITLNTSSTQMSSAATTTYQAGDQNGAPCT